MSVLPVLGSALPTDSDAAVVAMEHVDDVRGDTLDAVDEGVGRLCVHADSAEAWEVLHDKRSAMSFFGSAGGRSNKSVFLSYDGGDDRFSPVVGGWSCTSALCC